MVYTDRRQRKGTRKLHNVLKKPRGCDDTPRQKVFDKDGAATFLATIEHVLNLNNFNVDSDNLKITEDIKTLFDQSTKNTLVEIGFFERKKLTDLIIEIDATDHSIFSCKDHTATAEMISTLIRLAKRYTVPTLQKVFKELKKAHRVNGEHFKPFMKLMESFGENPSARADFIYIFEQLTAHNILYALFKKSSQEIPPLSDLSNFKNKVEELQCLRAVVKKIARTQYFKENAKVLLSRKVFETSESPTEPSDSISKLNLIRKITDILSDAKLINSSNLQQILSPPKAAPNTLYSFESLAVHYLLLKRLQENKLLTQSCLNQLQSLKELARSHFRMHTGDVMYIIPGLLTHALHGTLNAKELSDALVAAKGELGGIPKPVLSNSNPKKQVEYAEIDNAYPLEKRKEITHAFFEGTGLVCNPDLVQVQAIECAQQDPHPLYCNPFRG